MRDRLEPIFKGAALILGVLLLVQLGRAIWRCNPLGGVVIPALPALESATNSAGAAKPAVQAALTNKPEGTNATNHTRKAAAGKDTNAPVVLTAVSNAPGAGAVSKIAKAGTNELAKGDLESGNGSNALGLPPIASNAPGTGAVARIAKAGTNELAKVNGARKETNAAALTNASGTNTAHGPRPRGALAGAGMAMPPPGGPGKPSALPAVVQARVDRITDSEILGQVIRPMPMALLGIAGEVAFLRSASGQTGLAKVGEEVGGLKLIKIGTNRVLVEQDGQKKELTIFSGFGGESLMPK